MCELWMQLSNVRLDFSDVADPLKLQISKDRLHWVPTNLPNKSGF